MNHKQETRLKYNNIFNEYAAFISNKRVEEQKIYSEKLIKLMPNDNSTILDLGCGGGEAYTNKKIINKYKYYIGVDISENQIKRSRSKYPYKRFYRADITKLKYDKNTFDIITAFYSLLHLSISEQKKVIKNIYKWLSPNGVFYASVGINKIEGYENWFGKSYIASLGEQNYKNILLKNKFKIIFLEKSYAIDYNNKCSGVLWIAAKKVV